MKPKLIMAAAAVVAPLTFGVAHAAAPTSIQVVEEGEGGSAMSLKLTPATVKAGPVVFEVKNDAVAEEHEMLVVRLTSPQEKMPLVKAGNRLDEKKLESLGEVADLKPGASGELKVNLQPGTYLVFCNIKGHYQAGMASKLSVTK